MRLPDVPRVSPREAKPPTITLEELNDYVPFIREGAHALRREAARARRAFCPTDDEHRSRAASTLDRLARLLDVRGRR